MVFFFIGEEFYGSIRLGAITNTIIEMYTKIFSSIGSSENCLTILFQHEKKSCFTRLLKRLGGVVYNTILKYTSKDQDVMSFMTEKSGLLKL